LFVAAGTHIRVGTSTGEVVPAFSAGILSGFRPICHRRRGDLTPAVSQRATTSSAPTSCQASRSSPCPRSGDHSASTLGIEAGLCRSGRHI